MTLRRAAAFLTAFVLATTAAAGGRAGAAELTDTTYERWRDYVLPKSGELGYEAIPWRASFWDAVVEAQQKDKPILLWAMNGHPLACT